jgi:hypothetical protein
MVKITNNLHSKLIKIQTELNAPKNLHNSFGKYNYRSLESIFEGLKPLLKETGTTVVVTDEVVQVGDRIYIKATSTLSDGVDSISATAFARESESKKGMDASQLSGSCSSYSRKYAMNGLFAIDDSKDADSMDNTQPNPPPPKKMTASQLVVINDLVGFIGDEEVEAKTEKWLLAEHSEEQAAKMINKLKQIGGQK